MTAQTGATVALPIPTETAAAIPEGSSRSLRRWNRFLMFAHGGQFLLMVADLEAPTTLFEPVVPTVKPIIRTASSPGSSRRASCCSPSRSPT